MKLTVRSANASITGKGVTITRADIDAVQGAKGHPTTEQGVYAWAAIAALVRKGYTADVTPRPAGDAGAGTMSDEYVLANYASVPHVIIDARHLVATDDVVTLPNNLGNNFRKPIRDRAAGRPVRDTLARRLGLAGCVSWARVEGATFVFIAQPNMANYLPKT